MSLTINDHEVYGLARELAQLTGQSITNVVRNALQRERNRIEHLQQRERRTEELLAIAQNCAAHIRQPVTAANHGDMLYDNTGMPQ